MMESQASKPSNIAIGTCAIGSAMMNCRNTRMKSAAFARKLPPALSRSRRWSTMATPNARATDSQTFYFDRHMPERIAVSDFLEVLIAAFSMATPGPSTMLLP
eukprot:CAMPEP_0171668890 /NCGR_PEP_ID=MMETSP0990-20121206/49639_1 /TAXON_ID=483369 /ORGANISM="non described non described, Strain CCMP2098" /LENGTH=102 /DNA_ID=CAMNT_0012253027 /DNA_START=737 /DNA_END=1042 /DNA_ORIENTATION=-